MKNFKSLIFTCATLLTFTTVLNAKEQHGIAMHGEPKYPATFTHFNVVNPDAPKGGELKVAVVGTFDTLNPYILK